VHTCCKCGCMLFESQYRTCMTCIMCTCRSMTSFSGQRRDLEGDEGARIIHVEEAHWCCCRLSIADNPTLSQPARRNCLALPLCTCNRRRWNKARTGRQSWRDRQSRTLPVWCKCQQVIRGCILIGTKKKIPSHSCRVHTLYNMRA
jgi:hypothetical protein